MSAQDRTYGPDTTWCGGVSKVWHRGWIATHFCGPSVGKSVTDTAFALGSLASDEVGIGFGPSNDPTRSQTITFGGVDSSVLSGPINQVYVVSQCLSLICAQYGPTFLPEVP